MISTAISITKYENEAALEERREEEVDDDDDDDNDSVEKAAGAHNTREGCLPFGKDSINPEKNQISGEAKETARWQGSHFPLLSFANHLLPRLRL